MYLTRPRLRFDGIYVSRNQYLRRGVREWAYKGGVHVVVYYRYYRFFRDGTFVYKNSASNAKTVKNELARPIAIARDVAPTAGGGRRHRGSRVAAVAAEQQCPDKGHGHAQCVDRHGSGRPSSHS